MTNVHKLKQLFVVLGTDTFESFSNSEVMLFSFLLVAHHMLKANVLLKLK